MIGTLFAFFLCLAGAITAAGYYLVLRPSPAGGSTRELLVSAVRAVGERVPGAGSKHDEVRSRLVAAGYRSPTAAAVFNGLKCASALLAALIACVVVFSMTGGLDKAFIVATCGAGFGYLAPERALDVLAERRRHRLRAAIPPTLDMLVLGLEAGQPLDTALGEAVHHLRLTHPDLCGELAYAQVQMQLGKSRAEAFRNMAERNREPELKRCINLLLDADRFGSSPAPSLQTHARYLRTRMRQQAQEAARKLTVKLVFPVFFLILPSLLLVTLGPGVLQMMDQLQQLK